MAPLRVLLLEADATKALRIQDELRAAGFALEGPSATNLSEAEAALSAGTDLILADLGLVGANQHAFLKHLRLRGGPPVIVLSDRPGEVEAVEALRAGASHYLLKRDLGRLGPVVREVLVEQATWPNTLGSLTAQKLAAILDEAPDFVALLSLAGEPQYLNRAGRHLLGMPEQAALAGQHVSAWHPGRAYQAFLDQALPDALANGNWRGSSVLRRADGREVPVWQLLQVYRDPGGQPAYLSLHVRDLTEIRQLEEQYRQVQKMQAVGRLAAGVAHDFNNLLTIISGYAELLLGGEDSALAMKSYAQQILQAGEQASHLTRQLLAFSRKQVARPIVLDPGVLLANMEAMLRRLLGEDVRLTTLLQRGTGLIRADLGHLEQVVFNLAVNARDAMPEGGELTMETAAVDLGPEAIRSRAGGYPNIRPGPYVQLTFRDTGHGMDEATRAQIFEPFFTTKPPGQGTGLGLAIVYGIVQQHAGLIDVQSAPGQGTTVRISLPRTDGPLEEGAVSREMRGVRGTETVLVVEDEPDVRQLTVEALRLSGFDVVEAANGAEALRRLDELTRRVELVLTDVIMPEMSGPELVARIEAAHPGPRILYMSGYTEEAVLRPSVRTGRTHFLQKPFTPLALARKVREVLDEAEG
jgi:PAS domain S-box-containing protein